MRFRRSRTRRRAFVILAVAGVLLIALIFLGRAITKPGAVSASITQLMAELLSPAVRMAGRTRNNLSREPEYRTDPRTPVGDTLLQQLQAENAELRRELDLRDAQPGKVIPSEIIGRALSPMNASLTLDKGSSDGVEMNMVALTPDGVLGQVDSVSPHTARVMLMTDPASGIGAKIVRTNVPCVVKFMQGQCRLLYLTNKDDVQTGDQIITSGLGEIYPKGLPIGSVQSVINNPTQSTRTAIIQPFANPRLAEFVVLVKK